MGIVSQYKIYLYELYKQGKKLASGELFIFYISPNNICILFLYCNVTWAGNCYIYTWKTKNIGHFGWNVYCVSTAWYVFNQYLLHFTLHYIQGTSHLYRSSRRMKQMHKAKVYARYLHLYIGSKCTNCHIKYTTCMLWVVSLFYDTDIQVLWYNDQIIPLTYNVCFLINRHYQNLTTRSWFTTVNYSRTKFLYIFYTGWSPFNCRLYDFSSYVSIHSQLSFHRKF